MKKYRLSILLCLLIGVGCQTDNISDREIENQNATTLVISTSNTRTYIGEKSGDTYPVYWSEDDCIVANGNISEKAVINVQDPTTAQFTIKADLDYPRAILYSGEYSTDSADCIYFPTEQSYEANSIKSGYAPMYGYVTSQSENIRLKHLAGILRLPIKSKKSGTTLKSIAIKSVNGEPLAGYFAVDYSTGTLSARESTESEIVYMADTALSTNDCTVFNIVVPKGDYTACSITFTDSDGNRMVSRWNPSTIKAGVVRELKDITYEADTEFDLGAFDSYTDDFLKNVSCCGFVKDSQGNPLKGVVVSDGEMCVQSNENGYYELKSNLHKTKFIYISIPSGYKAQAKDGIPQFYYTITADDREEGYCIASFVLDRINGNADRYTLFIGADPQPRLTTAKDDKVAFHSLDICDDLYRDMRVTAAKITDREVYGLMLGDIVHEKMNLYANYVAGLKSLGFQMFNVIGNHDHDLTATTDAEGARCFEENFGPSYYSYNIGKLHFVVLDNIIMTVVDGKLKKNEYTYGLTDKQWTWLANDLKFVDKSTTLMVASHSPMFKLDNEDWSMQQVSTHGGDYATLLLQYDKVHAWAGHTHRSFNYNYYDPSQLKNIEVHTLARSTGEFWSNEYSAYGTPRGYTIVEVDGENISWKFKPTIYQSEYVGDSYSTIGRPEYLYRDWNYNYDGIAIMKRTGKVLDESYQMQAWRDESYIYVNIFLWDDKWEYPQFNGSAMTLLGRSDAAAVCLPYKELYDFYSANSILSESSSYNYSTPNYHNTIFRIESSSSTGGGTISVKDRFGNTYTSDLSW